MTQARRQAARHRAGIRGSASRPAELRVLRRDRHGLLGTTALQAAAVLILVTPAAAQLAPNAGPQGGTVVGGQVGISQTQALTTVQQSTQYGAINWQSYNVGSQHTVQYVQPNSAAMTLNRVVGPDPSLIAGKITANGHVVLVNQSGVVFDKGAQVDVQGLIVTSNNIRTTDFMAGKLVFDQPGSPNARIVNQGSITVKESGLAALVAPAVANQGVIVAKMGKVVLASGTAHTVDLYGDGLLSVDVTGQVKQLPVGPDGKAVTALVTNTGTIIADGGTVVLTARAVDGIVGNLVTAGGRIQANSAGGKAGRIEIAGVGGSVVIEGDVAAMGTMAGTAGGAVQALATDRVTVATGARIDVSGRAGGGTVALGTTLARAAGPQVTGQPVAKRVTVAQGATVAADATGSGKGGSIIVLSRDMTRMDGTLTARGGAGGGDGGFVEVSGDTGFALTGRVDVSAAAGRPGTILLDPFNLIVTETDPGTNEITNPDATPPNVPAGGQPDAATDSWIRPSVILAQLTGSIELQATNNLSVTSALDTTGSTITNVTLTAGNNLSTSAAITVANGNLTMTAVDAMVVGAPLSASGVIALGAGAGGIGLGANVNATVLSLTTTGGGAVTQSAGIVTVDNLITGAAVTGDVTLDKANMIGGVGISAGAGFSAPTGVLTLNNAAAVDLFGVAAQRVVVTADSITVKDVVTGTGPGSAANPSVKLVSTAGAITIESTGQVQATDATTGNIVLTSAAGIASAGKVSAAGAVAGGVVLLTAETTIQQTAGTIEATRTADNANVVLNAKGDITLAGTLSAAATTPAAGAESVRIVSSGGAITQSGGTIAATNAASGLVAIQADGTVTLAGLVQANGAGTPAVPSIAITSTNGAITQPNTGGTIVAGNADGVISLNAAGTIAFAGLISAGDGAPPTGTVIATAGGDFTEIVSGTTTGVLVAGLLTGAAADNIHLTNPSTLAGNRIVTIGDLVATNGDLQLRDTVGLTIAGGAANAIKAPDGSVFLQTSHADGITFGAAGTVTAKTAVALQTDTLINLGTAGATGVVNVTNSLFELAPNTDGALVSLGSTVAGELSLESLAGITSKDFVRIGAVTLPGGTDPTTFAGTIAIGGAGFDASTTAVLDLHAHAVGGGNGDVGQTAPLTAKALVGEAGSVTLTNPGNKIEAIGTLGAGKLGSLRASGDIAIVNSINLTVAGDVIAGVVGTVSQATGSLSIDVGANKLTVNGEASSGATAGSVTLTGGDIALTAAGGVLPVVATRPGGGATITAAGAFTQDDGVINAGAVTITAASFALSKGLIAAVNGTIGITAPVIGVTGTGTIATVNPGGTDITLTGDVNLANTALISALGALTVDGAFTQTGGRIASGGLMTLVGDFDQSGGAVQSSGGLLVGQLVPAAAGDPGTAGSTRTFNQTAGTIAVSGAIDVFAITFTQSGLIVSDNRVGVTASGGVTVAGTLSAGAGTRAGTTNQGFMLLSTGGDVTVQGSGLLGGPALVPTSGTLIAGNALQAPAGTVLIDPSTVDQPFVGSVGFTAGSITSNPYTLVSPALTVPLGTLAALPGLGLTVTAPSGFTDPRTTARTIPAVLVGETVDISRDVSATTLALYAKTLVTQSAPISAGVITGSAGILNDGSIVAGLITLGWTHEAGATPLGWQTKVGLATVDTLGNVTLTSLTNNIDTLSDFRVTQDFHLIDAPAGGKLGTTGTVLIGQALKDTYVQLGTPNPAVNLGSIDVIGTLLVAGTLATGRDDGAVRPGGNTTLTASGGITLAAGGVVAAVPSGDDGLQGGHAHLAAAGSPVVIGGGALLNAGRVDVQGTSFTLNSGTVVATKETIGITAEATINAGGSIATVNDGTDIHFSANVTQAAGGYVGANRDVTVAGTLAQAGGRMLAVRDITLGALAQTAGTVAAGRILAVGAGTGTPGNAGSTATSGSFTQSGGTALANDAVRVFVTQAVAGSPAFNQTGGTLASGGSLGITADSAQASPGSMIVIGGTVSATDPARGFMVLANAGTVTLATGGILAGPTLGPATLDVISGGATITVPNAGLAGNAVQAPHGLVQIAPGAGTVGFRDQGTVVVSTTPVTGYVITPPGPSVLGTLAAPSVTFAGTAARRPANLVGQSIAIDRPIEATVLGLYALEDITQTAAGTITADALTGSAGVLREGGMVVGATDLGGMVLLGSGGSQDTGLRALGWNNVFGDAADIGWRTPAGAPVPGTADILGSAKLDTAINQIGTLAEFRATQDFALRNGQALRQTGTLQAGTARDQGAITANAAAITLTAGALTVNGVIAAGVNDANVTSRPGGNVTLQAAGGITIATSALVGGAGPILPVIAAVENPNTGANGTVTLAAPGAAITQTAGLVNASAITLTAGSFTLSNGDVVAVGHATGGGTIGVTAGLTTINPGGTIATVNNGTDVTFTGAVTQNAGYVGANRDATVSGLQTQTGGQFLAVRDVALGGLNQSGGTVGAGRNVTIGAGTGTAGFAGSAATGGSFTQSNGAVMANGAINVFATGTFTQTGGTVAAGGTLGVTAATGLDIAGTISAAGAASGFMLLATGGGATIRGSADLAGANVGVSGPTGITIDGNAIQAPAGTVLFEAGASPLFSLAGAVTATTAPASGYTLVCPECTVAPASTLPAVPALTGPSLAALTPPVASADGAGVLTSPTAQIPVILVGDTIEVRRNLVASTIGLYAKSRITEANTDLMLNVGTITGSAGVLRSGAVAPGLANLGWNVTNLGWATGAVDTVGSVTLGGFNAIGTLSDFHATGDFALNNVPFGAARTLTQIGTMQAGSARSDSYGTPPAGTALRIDNQGTMLIQGTVADGIADDLVRPLGTVVLNAADFTTAGATGQPGSIDISGLVSANGLSDTSAPSGTVTLHATGRITEGGGLVIGNGTGTVIAGVLTGFSGTGTATGGSTTLDNIRNKVGTISAFTAQESLVLRNSTGTLSAANAVQATPTGTVPASTLILQNGTTGGTGDLTLNTGAVVKATNVTLVAPGTISNNVAGVADGTGSVEATRLTLPNTASGSTTATIGTGASNTGVANAQRVVLADPATAALTGANPTAFVNKVGTLSAVEIVSPGSLVFTNDGSLTLTGTISAPTICIGAKDRLTIDSGVTIFTADAKNPIPTVPQSSGPPDRASSQGLNLSIIGGAGTIDLGPNLTVTPLAGQIEAMMRIALPAGGQVLFGNLAATSTALLLHLANGTASMSGGGNINVGRLFVFYENSPPSTASLSGSVAGQSASGAATAGRVGREAVTLAFPSADVAQTSFQPSQVLQINQCAITSVNCVLTSILQVPPQLPLQPVYLPLPSSVLDDPDLLLPFITDQDD